MSEKPADAVARIQRTVVHGGGTGRETWALIESEIAAAEERGRRRGVEERDELRAAFRSAAVALNVATGWLTGLGRHKEAEQMRGWHQKAMDALAPRDSGKEG